MLAGGGGPRASNPNPPAFHGRRATSYTIPPGGDSRIRTCGTLRRTRFPDGHLNPLSHVSWGRLRDSDPGSLPYQGSAMPLCQGGVMPSSGCYPSKGWSVDRVVTPGRRWRKVRESNPHCGYTYPGSSRAAIPMANLPGGECRSRTRIAFPLSRFRGGVPSLWRTLLGRLPPATAPRLSAPRPPHPGGLAVNSCVEGDLPWFRCLDSNQGPQFQRLLAYR